MISITVDAIVQFSKQKKIKSVAILAKTSKILNEASISVSKGLYYDKTHTWAFMERNGSVKMGIDDFLVHVTGSLNRITLKNPGDKIRKGEPILSIIQNGKQLTINAPISGTIKSCNDQLIEDVSIIIKSPFQDGWVYTIEPSNWVRDSHFLIMADKYK